MAATLQIKPQEGPQTAFLSTAADIAVYGGSAGGGKTYALLVEPLRHVNNPQFGAVCFRRTLKQVKDEGGIWDQSSAIYPSIGAGPNLTDRSWKFPSGSSIQFAGLEHEASKFDWQGSQICLLLFDELTHFTEGQFFYLLTRNRSTCGVRPYVRATTNPGAGWVKKLLAPWVDRKFPNPARSGEIRWFVREQDQIVWVPTPPKRPKCTAGDDGTGCLEEGCENCFPPEKSITFIRASVFDNKVLLRADPGYLTNLMAQPELERRQLLDGDWDARPPHAVIDAFDEHRHVVPWRDTTGWIKAVGADFGTVNSAEVVLAEDPQSKDLYIIGEDWPGHSRSFCSIADAVRELAHGTPHHGAGGSKQEEGWRHAMRKEGIALEEPAYRDVTVQYQCVNDEFRANRLFVFDTCPKTIQMLLNFQRALDDDGLPTDKFDDTKWHLLAALRYIVAKMRPPKMAGFDSAMEMMNALYGTKI